MDVQNKLDDRRLDGIRAVVDVGDLLGTPDGPVGGRRVDNDVIPAFVLPVIRPGAAVRGAGASFISIPDIAGSVKVLAMQHRLRDGQRKAAEYKFDHMGKVEKNYERHSPFIILPAAIVLNGWSFFGRKVLSS